MFSTARIFSGDAVIDFVVQKFRLLLLRGGYAVEGLHQNTVAERVLECTNTTYCIIISVSDVITVLTVAENVL